ncbi:MerR family transcriptional regulator [Streptomyces sp. LP05-1]|uniref:MerR family transcriptional regulator n=1 Tax=Streptomyces pyxinae TaxID=2970734 RepID=A0ABT2CP46_9ACTN|nr:MerR family transcriptional regulator [Streptomyces sp. LP05-1]MCS0639208.1 MerR family transcriptional regulator [Streptomyces sp. LP05-1]
MRIGELAALVGVTTRAVRHYHHLGLLPEPGRLGNGYRDYTLRHAVVLARIRRLRELGLGLDEVADVLGDEAGRELVDVLEELDADLARQQERIAARRARLAGLLVEARAGRLPDEAPVSAELGALLAGLAEAAAGRPEPEPATAVRDRELLVLLDTVAGGEERGRLMEALRGMTEAPGALERAYAVYARLDELAGADAADPRVAEVARALAELLPHEAMGKAMDGVANMAEVDRVVAGPLFAEFSAGQAEAVRRALALVLGRGAR